MSNPSSAGTRFVVGILGVFFLLIATLAYAAWESGSYYESRQIQQAIDQQIGESR